MAGPASCPLWALIVPPIAAGTVPIEQRMAGKVAVCSENKQPQLSRMKGFSVIHLQLGLSFERRMVELTFAH
jgi:hypothetical protein